MKKKNIYSTGITGAVEIEKRWKQMENTVKALDKAAEKLVGTCHNLNSECIPWTEHADDDCKQCWLDYLMEEK